MGLLLEALAAAGKRIEPKWILRGHHPYAAQVRAKVSEYVAEVRREDPDFVHDARARYIRSEIERLEASVGPRRMEAGRFVMLARGAALKEFLRHLFDDSELERRIEKLKNELKFRELARQRVPDTITQDDIDRARAVPLYQVLNVPAGSRVNCLWHDDHKKTFALYADGKGHCFSCNKTRDAIDWLMHSESLTFLGAVRRLVR